MELQLYGGIDLHSTSNHIGIIDARDRRVLKKKLPNDPRIIVATLDPFHRELVGVVVESTFNWYCLVDLLMGEGYRVHLANPSGMKRYEGLKHCDDTNDAFWLAHLLRLGILPEGYIYPKEQPPQGSFEKTRASGTAQNLPYSQPPEHHQQKLRV